MEEKYRKDLVRETLTYLFLVDLNGGGFDKDCRDAFLDVNSNQFVTADKIEYNDVEIFDFTYDDVESELVDIRATIIDYERRIKNELRTLSYSRRYAKQIKNMIDESNESKSIASYNHTSLLLQDEISNSIIKAKRDITDKIYSLNRCKIYEAFLQDRLVELTPITTTD